MQLQLQPCWRSGKRRPVCRRHWPHAFVCHRKPAPIRRRLAGRCRNGSVHRPGSVDMPRKQTRGERAIRWIEVYCLVPSGLDRGQHVRLTLAQRDIVREMYDNPNGPHGALPVTGTLAAYMALLHVCGPEALQKEFRPEVTTNIFTVWGAVGPDLRAVLKREGERIVCPQLGTRYPVAA